MLALLSAKQGCCHPAHPAHQSLGPKLTACTAAMPAELHGVLLLRSSCQMAVSQEGGHEQAPPPVACVHGRCSQCSCSQQPACLQGQAECLSPSGLDESLQFSLQPARAAAKCQNMRVQTLIAQCRCRAPQRTGAALVLRAQSGAASAWCCWVQLTVPVLCRVLLRALPDCHHHPHRAAEDQAAASDCHTRHGGLCWPHPPAEAGAVQGGADRCRHCSHTTVMETAAASAAVRLQTLTLTGSSSGAEKAGTV